MILFHIIICVVENALPEILVQVQNCTGTLLFYYYHHPQSTAKQHDRRERTESRKKYHRRE